MLIAKGQEKKIIVGDIETMPCLMDFGFYDPDIKQWFEFEISEYKNDLYSFIKWYTSKEYDFFVGFNIIGFDQPVLQYVVDNYEGWYDKTGLEICKMIYKYVQEMIDNQKFDIRTFHKETSFPIYPLDLFKIHHFDNKAKMTSLKWCAFMMNMSVEEMPIHHSQESLTLEEIQMIKEYRKNDVYVTLGLFYLTLGKIDKIYELNNNNVLPELEDYNGKSKIQDRYDVMQETGMHCLNWSDVKIGEEWNKKDYKEKEKIKDDNLLLSPKIKQPYGQRFKKFFPSTMSFTTPLLQNFIDDLGKKFVKAEKQEFPITIGTTTYTIAKGGLHSTEKNRMVKITEGFRYDDLDVASQYPNSIVKLAIYPPHLKITLLEQFIEKIKRRFLYKDKANALKKEGKDDEARVYDSVNALLKLALNGGYYGKLGQKGSFIEYPEGLLKVCMGNQIEILMLIEMYESEGFNVLSGNTDGITVYYHESKRERFLEISKEWEEKVRNVEMGKLEETAFSAVWQESINSYIAKKTNNKIKKKGRFATEFEMHKNKSKRIIPLALEKYFIEGINPINFINSHNNIFDFCIAKKATGKMHYEEQWEENGKVLTKKHKKLVRYFISNNGNILYKRGFNYQGKPMNNHCEAETLIKQPLITYFNEFYLLSMKEYNIDYSYYIAEVLERIDNIEKTNKLKKYVESLKPQKQMSLF